MLVSRNFVDLFTLTRASSAWRFNSSGVLVQDTDGVPRFDYDPVTLQPRGMLVEESQTNIMTWSEDFTNAAWIKESCTVSGNVAVAPSGASTMDAIVEGAASSAHGVRQELTQSVGQTWTLSCFVKARERTFAQLRIVEGVSTNHIRANFDLTNGTVGLTASSGIGVFASAGIAPAGAGVFRCWITGVPAPSGTQVRGAVYCMQSDTGSAVYGGDGVSGIYGWGGQLNVGQIGSYIPTTSAAAARAADSAIVTDLSKIGFNPQAGTIYAEFAAPNMAAATNQSIFALTDGTVANRIQPFINGGTLTTRVTTGGVAADFFNSISGPSSTHKLAIGCAAGSAALSLDGGAATQTTPSAFPSVSKLCLGSGVDGNSAFLNGYLRALRYYPRRLSNSELQALTA